MTAHFTLADDKQVFVARPPSEAMPSQIRVWFRPATKKNNNNRFNSIWGTSAWQCNKNAGKLVILPTFATNYGRQPHRD